MKKALTKINRKIRNKVRNIVKEERKGIFFIIFFSAMVTFLIARLFVYLTDQEFHLIIGGYTIHHFFIGVLIISITGIISLSFKGHEYLLSLIYGIGLGLILDETGLLITWGDYSSRITYNLAVLFILISLNVIFFSDFWKEFGGRIKYQFKK